MKLFNAPKPGSNSAALAALGAFMPVLPIAAGSDAGTIAATCLVSAAAIGSACYFSNTELDKKDFAETAISIGSNVIYCLGKATRLLDVSQEKKQMTA